MAGSFTAVDLSRLPVPPVVEVVDFEVIFSEMLADLRVRDASFDALVESDPAFKILEVAAYRETIIRQRVNDAARAVMLAYAKAGDLDQLAALVGVSRLVLDPGNPGQGVAPTMESDEDFRRRVQLAPEGFSVAGPEGAYTFHALSADASVLDASATSAAPSDIRQIVMDVLTANSAPAGMISDMAEALDSAVWPGDVVVSILSRDGDGTASPELLSAVESSLASDDVRPLTDHVIVQSAQIVEYEIDATVYTYAGPDSQVVLAESSARLQRYITESHRLGRDVTRSGLFAAIHVDGVQRVELDSPATDVVVNRKQAAHCNSLSLNYGGVDE